MNLVAFAAGMLVYVALWELVARSLDVPMVSLGPAELAQRLGLVEAIALRLAPPAAAIALPGGDRPGALPPPPSNAPCPTQGPQVVFERKGHNRLEQELAHAHWVLGFWCGKSWHGGFVCDARVRH